MFALIKMQFMCQKKKSLNSKRIIRERNSLNCRMTGKLVLFGYLGRSHSPYPGSYSSLWGNHLSALYIFCKRWEVTNFPCQRDIRPAALHYMTQRSFFTHAGKLNSCTCPPNRELHAIHHDTMLLEHENEC